MHLGFLSNQFTLKLTPLKSEGTAVCRVKDEDSDCDSLGLDSTPLPSDMTLGRLLLSQAQYCLLENEDALEFISQVVENMYELSHSY